MKALRSVLVIDDASLPFGKHRYLALNTFSYVAPYSLIINHVLYYLVLFLDKVQISQVNYTVNNNCFQTQSSVWSYLNASVITSDQVQR